MPVSKQARKHLLKVADPFYARHDYPGAPNKIARACFYCGEPGSEMDHCPPLTWFEFKTVKGWRSSKTPLVKVLSCRDCNTRLGNKPLFSLAERVEFLTRKMEHVYEQEMALWSKEEIAEMSPMFARMIAGRKVLQQIHLDRIRHLQWRALHLEFE